MVGSAISFSECNCIITLSERDVKWEEKGKRLGKERDCADWEKERIFLIPVSGGLFPKVDDLGYYIPKRRRTVYFWEWSYDRPFPSSPLI